MRILYVAPKYDYGDPARGLSFEHCNFYDTLAHMGHEIIYFDSLTIASQQGRVRMNRRLMDITNSERPDLLFCAVARDEIDIEVMSQISRSGATVTYNWFFDDVWAFELLARKYSHAFNWVSTTAPSALPKYRSIGYENVIKTQFACNHFLYGPSGGEKYYSVTFVGQPHGKRREYVNTLRRAGVDVKAWGYGWEAGRLTLDEMREVFSTSKVNLNLTDASAPSIRTGWRTRFSESLIRKKQHPPGQIKGRNFEVPGCSGFMLTDMAEDLDQFYKPNKEIGVFRGVDDLIQKTRYYLEHEDERETIAKAGYQRTLREHTYEQRFNQIFSRMGFIVTSPVVQSPAG